MHFFPFPVYPSTHSQVKDPTVLVQVALLWQSSEFSIHSSISVAMGQSGVSGGQWGHEKGTCYLKLGFI